MITYRVTFEDDDDAGRFLEFMQDAEEEVVFEGDIQVQEEETS